MSGELRVHIKEAIFDRDVNSFLEMDPKYTINWKEELVEGAPAYGGSKTPKWGGEEYIHSFTVEDTSAAGVMTFSFHESDNLICQASIQVKTLIENRGTEQWYPTSYEG